MNKKEVPAFYEYLRWKLEREVSNTESFSISEAKKVFNVHRIPIVIQFRILKEMQDLDLLNLNYRKITLNKKYKPKYNFVMTDEVQRRILLA